jgi:hypothetical protein
LVIDFYVGNTIYAQTTTTGNQFIVGAIDIPDAGLVTVLLPPGRISQDRQLTFNQHSYFSCSIGGQVYTNNDRNALPAYAHLLTGGITTKIDDTIRTVWKNLNQVDVIQDIYPVAFTKSGQIVYKWKFLNHSASLINAGCQYLLDVQLTDPTVKAYPGHPNSDDGPLILTRWDYSDNWRFFPNTNPIPWFYAAFLYKLPNVPTYNPGLSAQGYTDYAPLGLIPPMKMTIGDWTKMIDFPFGSSGMPGGVIGPDCAVLLEFPPQDLPSEKEVELGRTSYGTGEFETCTGSLFGLVFYPHLLKWTKKGLSGYYTPNPIDIQFYAFDPDQFNPAAYTKLTLTVGNNLTIYDSINHILLGKSQTQPIAGAGTFMDPGSVSIPIFEWFANVDPAYFCMGDISTSLKFTGTSSLDSFSFRQPSISNAECDHSITIECAENDVDPPIWSVLPDTNIFTKDIYVHDDRITDRGLKDITWHPTGKKDSLNSSNFIVSYSAPIKPCASDKDIHTVHIIQLDSTRGACFDFTYEDCVGNKSFETVCFPSHPLVIIPDTLKPDYHLDLQSGSFNGTECNSRLDSFDVRDDRLHDKGLDSVFVVGTPINMTATIDSFGKHAPLVRFSLNVKDTMADGAICIKAIDGAGNYNDTCFFYCTIHDTLPPIVTIIKDPTRRGNWRVNVLDNRPWDRLIDSIYIFNTINVTYPPAGIPPPRFYTSSQPVYSFIVTAIDTMKPSSFCVKANDLAGNMSGSLCESQGIDTDAFCPNITISPDPTTSPTSISVFVDDIHFNDPPADKDTNIWDSGIDIVWFTNNTGIITPDTIHGNCAKILPPFSLSVFDTLKIDTQSCVTINARDCHGNICSYTWCYPYIADTLPPILTAQYIGHDSIAVQVSDSRIYDRGLANIKTFGEINLSTYDTTALSPGLYAKQFGLTRPNIDQSTYGSLLAVDFWGAHIASFQHSASVDVAIWIQDFAMKKGIMLREGSSFTVPVYFVNNDTFSVSSKGITDILLSLTITGDSGTITFDSVSTMKTEMADWSVSVIQSIDHILISASMMPKGKPLTADLYTNPPDSLIVLCFTAHPNASTKFAKIRSDSIIFNNSRDTIYKGISATAIMPPPWGTLAGTDIVIVGSCSPIIISDSTIKPTAVSLEQNHPNPFEKLTTFEYTVAHDGPVRFAIYDILGKEMFCITDQVQSQGVYKVTFDAAAIRQGAYIARLQTDGIVITRLIQLIK